MTGRQHYAAAEKLLTDLPTDIPDANTRIAEAQAHATLALAAATIVSAATFIPPGSNTAAWMLEVTDDAPLPRR